MPVPGCASPAHSSQDVSTASECSDTGLNEYKINATTPAVVAWEGQHAEFELLVQYDGVASTAFLKLRAAVALKGLTPAKTFLHLFIPPERIQTLTLDESPNPDLVPAGTADVLGSLFTCLRVSLNAAADLIGPKIVDIRSKNHGSGRKLDQFKSLARSVSFDMYVPHQLVSKLQLAPMCYGISDRLLGSEAGQLDLLCLYEGRGGAKIAVVESDQPTIHAPDVSQQQIGDIPPSYADAGPSSSVAAGPAGPPPSKRRRLNSEAAVELGSDWLEAMRQMVRDEVRIQVSDEVRKLGTRLKHNLETLMNKHYDNEYSRWTEDLEAMEQEFDNKIEDDFFGVRMKLEDYIKDELKEAEETIIERLESSTVRLEFAS